jgi:hypothetical protein
MFDDRNVELGTGIVRVSKRPYVDEPSHDVGQSWATLKVASWVSLSAVSAYDRNGALGGAAALFRLVHKDRYVLGTSAEAGYAWGGLSLSGALRILEDSWIYTAPRISNWGDGVLVGVPFGLSVHVVSGLHIRPEVQVSWTDWKYYNRRIHSGIAAAYDF